MERGGRARTIALGGGDGLDLTLVVGGAVDLVGRGSAGQAFPYGGAKAALNVLANVVHQGTRQRRDPDRRHCSRPDRHPGHARHRRRGLHRAGGRPVSHIDTSGFYGPATVNEVIRAALHPYPDDLHIVTKVGARRGADGSWHPALAPDELTAQVHENLAQLGLDALDVVNLRQSVHAAPDESIAEPFGTLAGPRRAGLVRHLGLSGVSAAQLTEARGIAPVVTVQNRYNLADRQDDELVDRCEREGIAFAPFFPLGGSSSLSPGVPDRVAARLNASPQQVALAWLLQRSSTMTVIPGTSLVAHLRQNIAAASLVLPADAIAELEAISPVRSG